MNPVPTEAKKFWRRVGGKVSFSRIDRENGCGGFRGRGVVFFLSCAVLVVWVQVFLHILVSNEFNHGSSSKALHDLLAEDEAERQRAPRAEAAIQVADTKIQGVSVGSLANKDATHESARRHPDFESHRPMFNHLHDQILAAGRTDGAWDKVSKEVVIAVKTGSDVYNKRLEWVNKTWLAGRKMPCLLYIADRSNTSYIHSMVEYSKTLLKGAENVTEEGLFRRTFEGGWKGDKDKNLPGFALMYDLFPDKKYYFMVDDDTYVFLDNLGESILQGRFSRADEKPAYMGRFFAVPKPVRGCFDTILDRSPYFAHGGSGIMMNHASTALIRSRIAECISEFHGCWGGDIQTSLCWHRVTEGKNRKLEMKGRKRIFGAKIFEEIDKLGNPDETDEQTNPYLSTDLPITLHDLEPRQLFEIARYDRLLPGDRTLRHLYYYLLNPIHHVS
eukprot:CAMPEP_0113960140 /NCGR_PEP_ID=MMETSP0011_2-20120614/4543_1 /TAXON_ID=101924 /ORGANISM="Rhodosorus marinus" /LENGTH=444 /DNA_ID=CAMNT_0000971547 /DNA_START=177 /DNA_END=1511 /DNA_ORIENTATION=+ /assembly_acc=CAM_ASM_000156